MRPPTSQYEPALDGLRGVAVAGVFLFHCGLPWMPGGFLGVSTFFTLSGYLITSLLLAEWTRTGRIDLARFWQRRLRRLVPALVVAVAGVTALAPLLASEEARRRLAGDAAASLLYVANWHFGLAGDSYAELFRRPSPLLHAWSLGIEGQFYLAFPPLLWGALRAGGPRGAGALVACLAALSCGASIAARGPDAFDRVYYGTDTRAAELLAGAGLALWRGRRAAPARPPAPAIAWAGVIALGAQVAIWTVTTMQTSWVVRGGLGLYAMLSACIVRAALERDGPLHALLARAPVRRLGQISYGVYLFHWPIVLWLTPEGTGLPAPLVHACRAALAVLAAELSYRALEQPVRAGRLFPGRAVFRAALAGTAALAIAARLVPAPPPDPLYTALEGAPGDLVTEAELDAVRPRNAIPYSFFGDSSALGTARAFRDWAERTVEPAFWPMVNEVRLGCGIMGAARRSTGVDRWAGECAEAGWGDIVRRSWGDIAKERALGLAVVQSGVWETFEHELAPGDRLRALGDPVFDAYLKARMERIVDALSESAVVVWVLAPHLVPGGTGHLEAPPAAIFDPRRIDRHNRLVREVAAARRDVMEVLDLPALLATTPNGELDLEARPDGVHFTATASTALADKVGPAVTRAYLTVLARRARRDRPAPAGETPSAGAGGSKRGHRL